MKIRSSVFRNVANKYGFPRNQGKSEGFDSCDWLNNIKLDSYRWFFSLCDLEIWWMTSKNNRALLPYYIKLCASFQIHQCSETWVTVRKRSIPVKIGDCFVQLDFEIWWMTLKNNRATFLCYIKLCVSFSKPWVNSNWRYSPETLNSSQNRHFFLSRVTLKFDRWPWISCFTQSIGHLSYAVSSFVHHFIAIGKFKLELQAGNAQFRSKSTIF